jgi:hypothetical protein
MERYLTSERRNCKPLDIETLQSILPTIQRRAPRRIGRSPDLVIWN